NPKRKNYICCDLKEIETRQSLNYTPLSWMNGLRIIIMLLLTLLIILINQMKISTESPFYLFPINEK
ncbi:hypothetical protein, partial [Bacteroides thetaiotaomicron]|uniref:hypothetical protein n=1 Tax=Bacteroides thetaiotaomicron TaxID=818 RepID=UPI00232C2AAE